MRLLFWNCQGIGNIGTQNTFADFCKVYKPDIVAWLSQKFPMTISSQFWSFLGLSLVADNNSITLPSMWILVSNCYSPTRVALLRFSDQHMTLKVFLNNEWHLLTSVYASVLSSHRRRLCHDLSSFASLGFGNWYVIGDFNAYFTLMRSEVVELIFDILVWNSDKPLIVVMVSGLNSFGVALRP